MISVFKHNDPAANILGMLEGFSDKHNYIRMTPQAFSHFTYHQTAGQRLVMDVQGVGDVYTDPQIVSAQGDLYGAGLDNGMVGMLLFSCSHICNPICEELGLSPFHLSGSEIDMVCWLWDDMRSEITGNARKVFGRPMHDGWSKAQVHRSTTWHTVMRRRRTFRATVDAVIAVNRVVRMVRESPRAADMPLSPDGRKGTAAGGVPMTPRSSMAVQPDDVAETLRRLAQPAGFAGGEREQQAPAGAEGPARTEQATSTNTQASSSRAAGASPSGVAAAGRRTDILRGPSYHAISNDPAESEWRSLV